MDGIGCIYNVAAKSGCTCCSITDKPTPDFCEDRCVDFATTETATEYQLEEATVLLCRIRESEREVGTWKVVSIDFE